MRACCPRRIPRIWRRERIAVPSPNAGAEVPANSGSVRLGLGANWEQFTLLVAVNAFVGATVGIERVILPLLAEREFGLASRAAILSFIVSFGLIKAIANLFAGRVGDQWGPEKVLGPVWAFVLPLPILTAFSPSWASVGFA